MIGDLKHRITFQILIIANNENGFEEEVWQDYKIVWASVSNLSGREYYQAAGVQSETTVKFLIRYFEDINTEMRILFKDNQYNINSVDNIKYENKYIELRAVKITYLDD